MKGFKKFLYVFLGVLSVFFLFLLWYQNRYSMDLVEPYEVKTPGLEKKLLIAAQGSDFKDKVVKGIVDRYSMDSIYIQVIDIKDLQRINPKDYDALLIVHTWENWKPPVTVKIFIERTDNYQDRIVVLTTSGEGSYKMKGVDAITGESIIKDVPLFIRKIADRLDPIFKDEDHL
ncbi:hypothetical protein PP182_10240 [Maribacter sp. PR1]|uniref:TPM domain-containing protein n=1 Tax=Maribacter cobaltidurans TaxID=1178778 RepID=A0ABU7ITZ4_9FLAO|nr:MULTISPECIES: hypothetical protein [Maribacter]MDC6389060.1 hypothetical protein [Maribacter sp. PR1]MEE1976447.1 hypothetical protein [Maribacter cobaltidurans]